MTKIWIVEDCVAYEGCMIGGIYSTKRKASKVLRLEAQKKIMLMKKNKKIKDWGEYKTITVREVK